VVLTVALRHLCCSDGSPRPSWEEQLTELQASINSRIGQIASIFGYDRFDELKGEALKSFVYELFTFENDGGRLWEESGGDSADEVSRRAPAAPRVIDLSIPCTQAGADRQTWPLCAADCTRVAEMGVGTMGTPNAPPFRCCLAMPGRTTVMVASCTAQRVVAVETHSTARRGRGDPQGSQSLPGWHRLAAFVGDGAAIASARAWHIKEKQLHPRSSCI
jgi:hypothetical protein